MYTLEENKICTRCGIMHPLSNFGKNKRGKNGLAIYCRPCLRKMTSDYNARNRLERAAGVRRRYRELNPERDLSGKNKCEAIELGKKTYIGKPCKVCGEREKLVSSSNCTNCAKKRIESGDFAKTHRKYRQTGKGKARNALQNAKRRTRQKNCEILLTENGKLDIQKIYSECPKGWEVDHIIPLNGKTVCGLHVPWNLKAKPKYINRMKSNKEIWEYGTFVDKCLFDSLWTE